MQRYSFGWSVSLVNLMGMIAFEYDIIIYE